VLVGLFSRALLLLMRLFCGTEPRRAPAATLTGLEADESESGVAAPPYSDTSSLRALPAGAEKVTDVSDNHTVDSAALAPALPIRACIVRSDEPSPLPRICSRMEPVLGVLLVVASRTAPGTSSCNVSNDSACEMLAARCPQVAMSGRDASGEPAADPAVIAESEVQTVASAAEGARKRALVVSPTTAKARPLTVTLTDPVAGEFCEVHCLPAMPGSLLLQGSGSDTHTRVMEVLL
jgi:hypothetical protein